MTDEELVLLCIKNDRKGQKLLFEKFVSSMARLCLRYLKDNEDARETISEGFVKVFAGIQKFEHRGKGSLEAWIRKIMVNECLMKLRNNKKLVFLSFDKNDPETEVSFESDISAEEIISTISMLPDGYRTVFNLYVIEGYSHKEIGDMLQISESASRSQLSHAKNRLRELLINKGWK